MANNDLVRGSEYAKTFAQSGGRQAGANKSKARLEELSKNDKPKK
jgi:hypothetical protein